MLRLAPMAKLPVVAKNRQFSEMDCRMISGSAATIQAAVWKLMLALLSDAGSTSSTPIKALTPPRTVHVFGVFRTFGSSLSGSRKGSSIWVIHRR